jgi:hypothetical protein
MTITKKARTVEAAADAMESYIHTYGHVSMVELERVAGEHLGVSGDLAWLSPDDRHIRIWLGMSEEFVKALELVLKRGRVEPKASNPLVYLIDGKVCTLPVAKRPPKGGYKEDHWLPVVFNPKGASGETRRLA